jgi:hypothetical protein
VGVIRASHSRHDAANSSKPASATATETSRSDAASAWPDASDPCSHIARTRSSAEKTATARSNSGSYWGGSAPSAAGLGVMTAFSAGGRQAAACEGGN